MEYGQDLQIRRLRAVCAKSEMGGDRRSQNGGSLYAIIPDAQYDII